MAEITMPQLGETVTEGTITRWLKQVGDNVAEDEVLFEVSTDKVDSEVPSPVAGTLVEIRANEGDVVPVGNTIAVVSDAGGAAASPTGPETVDRAAPGETADELAQRDVANKPVDGAPADTMNAADLTQAPAETEAARSTAEAARVADPAVVPAGSPELPGAHRPAAAANTQGMVLSPVVRKLINENNLDPGSIQGTGAGGRITRADVEKLIGVGSSNGGSTAAPPAAFAPPQSAAPPPPTTAPPVPRATAPAPVPAPPAGQTDTRIPFSNVRRRTAEHMIRSKATSAHTLVVVDVDFENVDRVRRKVKDSFKREEGISLTYLPFISRAVVDSLREFPHLNASVGNDELIVHNQINLGFAVDMNFEGLIVPVIQQADGKRMRAIARELSDLANRARGKKLGADDIANGTFTITNAGGYGTVVTYPVINQPQVAILSTDGVKKRPVVVPAADGSDAIVIHPVGNLALAWDHRAVDGAYAAAFMARVRDILETRDWDQEL